VLREARRVLNDGEARLMYLGPAEDLDGHTRDGVVAVPIACASEGALEVFMEPVLPRPHVVVIGRSPAVRTLTRLVVGLDWRATVVDDGGGAVDVPEEATVIASLAERGGAGIDGATAVVVATQGPNDEPAVEAARATDAPYIGRVASRNRSESVLGYLRDRGHTDEALRRIHTPAGLDLGHIEHREIAVAVLAELVAIRASGGIAGPVAAATTSGAATPSGAADASEAAEPETAIDPICGMTVDTATARFTSEHNGTTVYFCCPACRKTYDDALV
jgi:xanthine dehydrogenase accessory factor